MSLDNKDKEILLPTTFGLSPEAMRELEQGLREAGIHTPDMQGMGMNSPSAANDP